MKKKIVKGQLAYLNKNSIKAQLNKIKDSFNSFGYFERFLIIIFSIIFTFIFLIIYALIVVWGIITKPFRWLRNKMA